MDVIVKLKIGAVFYLILLGFGAQAEGMLDAPVTPEGSLNRVLQIKQHTLEINLGNQPYVLAASLFSDYAYKLRTVSVPQGTSIS